MGAFRRRAAAILTVPWLMLSGPALAAFPVPVQFSAAEVEYQGIRIEQLRLETVADQGIHLSIASFQAAAQPDLEAIELDLQCPQLGAADSGWCPEGEWRVQLRSPQQGWQEDLHGKLGAVLWNDQEQSLASSLAVGGFSAGVNYQGDSPDAAAAAARAPAGLSIEWKAQQLAGLPFRDLLPGQLGWVKSGTVDGRVELTLPVSPGMETDQSGPARQPAIQLDYRLGFKGISLDSPDGRFAAEGLDLAAQGRFTPGDQSLLRLESRFQAGQLLLDQFYTEFGPYTLQLDTRLAIDSGRVEVQDLRVNDGNSLQLQASARFATSDPMASLRYQVQQLDLEFPLAYERYLESVLATLTLDDLTVTGGINWAGSGAGGAFPSGTLSVEELSVVDHEQDRFAFTGMTAHIEAGESSGKSDFSWRGLLLGRINLGAGSIELDTAPGLFELAAPLRLEVLGGDLVVDEFGLQLPAAGQQDAEPAVNFNASLDALDMEQLTAALGWPTFAGKVSGRIPGVSFDQGVLTVDGLISFEAFDGQIRLSDLRVERLFGVLPSFAADLEVDNLNLQLLTSTFSFGNIAGRLDGYVHDLRMLDWSPVSFDAWMGTPESQSDSRSISRQAVNNLTSIGGGGATAALTGPIMRLFSNFSYRRLGMGCKLENYVCAIRGLEDEENSVLIMEGSGVPNLSIRVFNRRMDWPQLVANLEAATSGGDIRIGDP